MQSVTVNKHFLLNIVLNWFPCLLNTKVIALHATTLTLILAVRLLCSMCLWTRLPREVTPELCCSHNPKMTCNTAERREFVACSYWLIQCQNFPPMNDYHIKFGIITLCLLLINNFVKTHSIYPRRARSALGVDTVLTLDVCLYVCMLAL